MEYSVKTSKYILENICIVYIQQFWIQVLFDLVLLEHLAQDVSVFVYMLRLDLMLHLNQFQEYEFLVLMFLVIYEVNTDLPHQPIYQLI